MNARPESSPFDNARWDLLTFGETMIRLTAAGGHRLEDARSLDVAIGGTESNVCVALARLGRRVAWISSLADNPLGRRVASELRSHAVDTSLVRWSSARAGVYFLDPGAPPRPTSVYYDRAGSAVSVLTPDDVDCSNAARARVLHLTGITPALSAGCAAICRQLSDVAVANGVPVIFDVNYRAKLWSADAARRGIEGLCATATVLLCGESDAAAIWGVAGSPDVIGRGLLDRSGADLVVVTLAERGAFAINREGHSWTQPAIPVQVVDPVGAGDAFAAGFVDRWLDDRVDVEPALRSGVALAALKMTMPGDHAIVRRDELDVAMTFANRLGPDIVR